VSNSERSISPSSPPDCELTVYTRVSSELLQQARERLQLAHDEDRTVTFSPPPELLKRAAERRAERAAARAQSDAERAAAASAATAIETAASESVMDSAPTISISHEFSAPPVIVARPSPVMADVPELVAAADEAPVPALPSSPRWLRRPPRSALWLAAALLLLLGAASVAYVRSGASSPVPSLLTNNG